MVILEKMCLLRHNRTIDHEMNSFAHKHFVLKNYGILKLLKNLAVVSSENNKFCFFIKMFQALLLLHHYVLFSSGELTKRASIGYV